MRAGAGMVAFIACASACVSPAPPVPAQSPHPALATSTSATTATILPAAIATATKEASIDPESTAPVAAIAQGEGVGVVEGSSGWIGAWLALGPFKLPEKNGPKTVTSWRPPVRLANGANDPSGATIDDHAFSPAYGASLGTFVDRALRENDKDGKPKGKIKSWVADPATWTLAASAEAIDLEKIWNSGGKPAVGYLASVLRLPVAAKLTMILGSDDGCELIVDGTTRFVRDGSRALRDDDDFVPLDLSAGDHVFVLKLHQHDAGWGVHVRLVDASLRPPLGARWLLPKAPVSVADELAKAMSRVRIVRSPEDERYSLRVEARYPEGAPIAPSIAVAASVLSADGAQRIEKKSLGVVSIGPRAPGVLEGAIAEDAFAAEENAESDLVIRVEVAGRVVDGTFHPRRPIRAAIARARALLRRWKDSGRPDAIPDDVSATIEYLSSRLADFTLRGDDDVRSQLLDAKDLDDFVAEAEKGDDPLAHLDGAFRLAHVSDIDGRPQPFAFYVPHGFESTPKKLPLYVVLHGMNSGPMSALRVFFGGDDEGKTMGQLDRRFEAVQSTKLSGFVLSPNAHGNTMYRQLGEEDVMRSIAWAIRRYPQIDTTRIYVTGYSMGGIGAAWIPLHHPDVFAAAEPLCGYHSYAIRRDVVGRPQRPWESFLIEDRSNSEWAWNGMRLPMFVIHGTHDLPEENSGVLIDAYKKLGYSLKEDHPDKGHDVWGLAYDSFHQVSYFGWRKSNPHPSHVRFKTTSPRWGDDAWVHVLRLSTSDGWAVIDATIKGTPKNPSMQLKTKNVDALTLDRDPTLVDADASMTIAIDGKKITVDAGAPLVLHRGAGGWSLGPPPDDATYKEGHVTGPMRDVWNEPLRIVYGASDPLQRTANREVAEALARVRWGVDVSYPILRDDEVDANEAPSTATILVGNAKSNAVLRALDPKLPLHVNADGTITFAQKTYAGNQLGAAFVVPHPNAPTKYLLVVEGVDALGTLRALSLPELLPDFVIWDETLAPAHGQQLLSWGSVRAAGFFDVKWQPPTSFDDPSFAPTSAPKNEKDTNPYLP